MEALQVKTAIIGLGRWGKNVARELALRSNLVGYVTTGSPDNLAWAHEHLKDVRALSLEELCADTTITAVAITSPIATHAESARKLLTSGKHVLVEKPLAETLEDADELVQLATKHNLTLMTGYVFLYHPIYQELKRRAVVVGIQRVEAVWKKHGTFTERIESNLLTHHLALACDLLGMPVSGTVTHAPGTVSDCDGLETHLQYSSAEFVSHIDRTSEERQHIITVHLVDGSVLVWNETELTYRSTGDSSPEVVASDTTAPLGIEISAFIESVAGNNSPSITSGSFGRDVVSIHSLLAVSDA